MCDATLTISNYSNLMLLMVQAMVSRLMVPGKSQFLSAFVRSVLVQKPFVILTQNLFSFCLLSCLNSLQILDDLEVDQVANELNAVVIGDNKEQLHDYEKSSSRGAVAAAISLPDNDLQMSGMNFASISFPSANAEASASHAQSQHLNQDVPAKTLERRHIDVNAVRRRSCASAIAFAAVFQTPAEGVSCVARVEHDGSLVPHSKTQDDLQSPPHPLASQGDCADEQISTPQPPPKSRSRSCSRAQIRQQRSCDAAVTPLSGHADSKRLDLHVSDVIEFWPITPPPPAAHPVTTPPQVSILHRLEVAGADVHDNASPNLNRAPVSNNNEKAINAVFALAARRKSSVSTKSSMPNASPSAAGHAATAKSAHVLGAAEAGTGRAPSASAAASGYLQDGGNVSSTISHGAMPRGQRSPPPLAFAADAAATASMASKSRLSAQRNVSEAIPAISWEQKVEMMRGKYGDRFEEC